MRLGRESFRLICGACGKGHSGSMRWLQMHSVLDCDSCGSQTKIDKDTALKQLAQHSSLESERSEPHVFLATH